MLSLALLVALSPVLIFKGLTVAKLVAFFNLHPFWAVFFAGLWFKEKTVVNCGHQFCSELKKKIDDRIKELDNE